MRGGDEGQSLSPPRSAKTKARCIRGALLRMASDITQRTGMRALTPTPAISLLAYETPRTPMVLGPHKGRESACGAYTNQSRQQLIRKCQLKKGMIRLRCMQNALRKVRSAARTLDVRRRYSASANQDEIPCSGIFLPCVEQLMLTVLITRSIALQLPSILDSSVTTLVIASKSCGSAHDHDLS